MSALPVVSAHELEQADDEARWLVEGLWSDQAVGIVGGEPKCCKSFLALDLALAVASGTRCLRRFPAQRTGRVLLYAAEDAPAVVRERLEGIARASDVELERADLKVITAPSLRLDLEDDKRRLEETIAEVRPLLLVLDPFVRLHRRDENASGDVAPLLAYLRELQRRYQLAVLVVHHAKKGASRARPGQALRGSSEFHAWGDSNLYLRRCGEKVLLSIEHRAAPSPGDLALELRADGDRLALAIEQRAAQDYAAPTTGARRPRRDPVQAALDALAQATEPLPFAALRRSCRIRTASLYEALGELTSDGRVEKTQSGYRLASH